MPDAGSRTLDNSPLRAPSLFALAVDHRTQFREAADRLGVDHGRFGVFKRLAVAAAAGVADEEDGRIGVLCDGEYGEAALRDAERAGLWVARPVEEAGSRPLRLVGGPGPAAALRGWSEGQVVKCLVHYAADDPAPLRDVQEATLIGLAEACHAQGRELLLEVLPPMGAANRPATVAAAMERLYGLGLQPAWWKLEPFEEAADWERLGRIVAACDPACRGILVLGLTREPERLARAFAAARGTPQLRGFAVGRAIVGEAFEGWLAGRLSDNQAQEAIAARLRATIASWRGAGA